MTSQENETDEELHDLFSETMKRDKSILIKSFHPHEPLQFSAQISPKNAHAKYKRTKSKNLAQNLDKKVCSIPSIPSSKRKFGYYEAVDGILFPLVDAFQYLREGNVIIFIIFNLVRLGLEHIILKRQ